MLITSRPLEVVISMWRDAQQKDVQTDSRMGYWIIQIKAATRITRKTRKSGRLRTQKYIISMGRARTFHTCAITYMVCSTSKSPDSGDQS